MTYADRVTIIVPTYDGMGMFAYFVESLSRSLNAGPEFMVLRHRNRLLDDETRASYDKFLTKLPLLNDRCYIEYIDGEFNYSNMMNYAVGRVRKETEFICLANDDIIFGTHNWLRPMIDIMDNDHTAAIVGCKLLYPRDASRPAGELVLRPVEHFGTVQHAGVCIVQEKGSTHIYKGRPCDYAPTLHNRQVEAVTFALVLIRRDLFDHIGFDPRLDCDFNDIDFCMQAAALERGIHYCASSVHFHLETVTRKKYQLHAKPRNKNYFMSKWRERISAAPTLAEFTGLEPFHQ